MVRTEIDDFGKVYFSDHYEVLKYKDTGYGLLITHDGTFEPTTLEMITKDIDDLCAGARAEGYHNDEKWQIVKVQRIRRYNKDDVFCASSESRIAVALYDNGKVTILR